VEEEENEEVIFESSYRTYDEYTYRLKRKRRKMRARSK